MNVKNMTINELKATDYCRPVKDFNAIVIVPTGVEHYSGYECMDFILCDGTEVVGKVGGGSDVMNINGIGGYGDWRKGLKKSVKPIDWSIDCLPKSHLVRLFSGYSLKLPEFIGSSFEFYVKED